MARAENFQTIASETVGRARARISVKTGFDPTAAVSLEYLGQHDPETRLITRVPNRVIPRQARIAYLVRAVTGSAALAGLHLRSQTGFRAAA